MNILKVKDLKKNFGQLGVLKGVSFDVEQGDVIAIIGESGSGKSTLLRCIIGLEEVDAGAASFCDQTYIQDGKPVSAVDMRSVTSKMGMVFQQFNLFPHYTVANNLIKPYEMTVKENGDAKERCEKLLEKVGLLDKINEYPSRLSGGQQQRVAIARALMKQPKLMLFDEPTSSLDPRLTGEVLSIMKKLASEKMTMLVVTHEMSFAMEAATKVIFMANGVIVEAGTPQEVLKNPQRPETKSFLGLG